MRLRPLPVTIAAILMALFSLMNFPGPWWYAIPGAVEETPMFVIYSGIVLGIVGIVAAVGLWMMKRWSFWLTIVVSVLNFLLGLPPVFLEPGVALKAFIAVTEIVAVLIVVLVMLPGSRRAFAAT